MSTVTTPPPQAAQQEVPIEPPRRGWWMTKRFLLAALGIILLSGGATAVLALNEVGKLVDALAESRPVKIAPTVLAPTSKGAPETLLLVGNDQRPAPRDNPNGFVIPHSNEMLLVRIDPSKPTISMLSIPRELQVTIHPHDAPPDVTRINAAYGIGGAQLMTETIKQVLGISVNHVFVLTFKNFRRAVDEIGCVYMGVDRRYHHVNEPGGEQYFEINLQPGYQRLCGTEALEFVANRHEDTSLTRDARDQRFLLEAKAQYGGRLFESREKFERILGRTVETDLHGTGAVLDLLELLVESAGKPVRQVHFNVTLLPAYDVASEQQINESVQSFLNGTAAIHKQRLSGVVHRASHVHHAIGPGPTLTPTTAAELEHARSQAPLLPFPLEYPRARDSFAGAEPDALRLYSIRDQQGHLHATYVIVVDRGQLGQFYDVQGSTWTDPPLLSDPGQTVHAGPRTYELFYAGEKVRAIAWHEGEAVYWIENTLTNDVSPHTMLAMAEQVQPVIRARSGGAPATLASVRGANLAPRAAAVASSASKMVAALGVLGLVIVAVFSLIVFARQRELKTLREQVAQALALEAHQRPLFAVAGIPYAEPAPTVVPDATRTPVPTPKTEPPATATPAAAAPATSTPAAATSTPAAAAPATSTPAPAAPPTSTPAPAAPATSTPDAAPGPTIYRTPRRWGREVLALAAVTIAAVVVAFGGYRLYKHLSSPSKPAGSAAAVAVYNATTIPNAAHRVAATLRMGHVQIGAIGDISTSLSPGNYVLYPPGDQAEARRVARLLPSPAPTVEPIQPQLQEAVGRHDEIIVVLD